MANRKELEESFNRWGGIVSLSITIPTLIAAIFKMIRDAPLYLRIPFFVFGSIFLLWLLNRIRRNWKSGDAVAPLASPTVQHGMFNVADQASVTGLYVTDPVILEGAGHLPALGPLPKSLDAATLKARMRAYSQELTKLLNEHEATSRSTEHPFYPGRGQIAHDLGIEVSAVNDQAFEEWRSNYGHLWWVERGAEDERRRQGAARALMEGYRTAQLDARAVALRHELAAHGYSNPWLDERIAAGPHLAILRSVARAFGILGLEWDEAVPDANIDIYRVDDE